MITQTKRYVELITKKYRLIKELDKKLFWVICPVLILVALISAIATAIEHLGPAQNVFAFACPVIAAGVMVYVWISGNFRVGYSALCIFLGGIILPVTLMLNGGLHSGMPLYCFGGTLLSFFCYERRQRYLTFSLVLGCNVLALIISARFPALVRTIRPELVKADIISSFVLVVVSSFFICSLVLDEFRDYAKTQYVLRHYMDENVRQFLLESESLAELAQTSGRTAKATILFADISNFTSYSELLPPEETVNYLNTFLTVAERCIHANGGTIDKYIGDCVLAFWLDPEETGDGVYQACKCVMDIQSELYKRSDEIYNTFGHELTFGAGIGYGTCIIGGIGSENRRDFTLTGDAVNLASRVQAMAPRGNYYLSESAAKIMRGQADVVLVQRGVVVKGKSMPIDIYALKSLHGPAAPQSIAEPVGRDTGYRLHICGCRGSYSVAGFRYSEFGGETSCYVIKKGDHAIVVDCGTGLYNARDLLRDCRKIDILLSHVHYDHILGLLDFSIFPSTAQLTFYGTFSEWNGNGTLGDFLEPPYWPVNLSRGEIVEVTRLKTFSLDNGIRGTYYEASHPDHSNLIVLDIGEKRVCFMADCENPWDLPEHIVNRSDIVLFDGMFEDENYVRHVGWGHSTWQEGVRLADRSNVGRLIITHHNPRSSDATLRELQSRAQAQSPRVTFAREGDIYII